MPSSSPTGRSSAGHGAATVIVTGGGRGIGAAVARLAGARGYAVVVNYVGDAAAAQAVVADISAGGGHAVAIRADVARESEVVALFEAASDRFGPVTGLVANAGISGRLGVVADLPAADLWRVLSVNVGGVILCAREAVRRMSTARGGAGGAIVTISSRAARIGGAGEWVHYAASKGAVETFTRGLAVEVAAEGIRVNCVAPGLVDTDLHAAAGAPERPARMAPTIPMRRAGSCEEIAEGVLWLLSPAASYTTGAVLDIAGGR